MNLLQRLFHRHRVARNGYFGVTPAEKCCCGHARPVRLSHNPLGPHGLGFSGKWRKNSEWGIGFSIEGDVHLLEFLRNMNERKVKDAV